MKPPRSVRAGQLRHTQSMQVKQFLAQRSTPAAPETLETLSPPAPTRPTSKVVRLLRGKDQQPVSVRVALAAVSVEHLMATFKRLHVATDNMALVDADTWEQVTPAYVRAHFGPETPDQKPVELRLCPTSELVEVDASLMTDEDGSDAADSSEDRYVALRVHNSIVASAMCAVAAHALQVDDELCLLSWDLAAVQPNERCIPRDRPDADMPADLVFARKADLVPVAVTVALSGDCAKTVAMAPLPTPPPEAVTVEKTADGGVRVTKRMLFHKQVTVAAVFRTVLLALFRGPRIFAQELEFLDPLRQPIDEPASLTLQQCITRCGFVELPAGMDCYPLVVDDGAPVAVSYRGTSSCSSPACTVVVPPSGETIEALRATAHAKMGLPGLPSEYFLSTGTGIALMDTSTDVSAADVADGLVLADAGSLLSVTMNDSCSLGFARESRPTVATLVSTMGLLPDTAVCYENVVVNNATTPLVQGGAYCAVDVQDAQFMPLDILLPGDDYVRVVVHGMCTAAQLLEVTALMIPTLCHTLPPPPPVPGSEGTQAAAAAAAAASAADSSSSSDKSALIPALMDDTECILADDLRACDFPRTTLQYCLV